MRCSCCDRALSDKEVVWNDDLKSYELCTVCLDIALDAAYNNGFDPDDDMFVLIDDDLFDGDDPGYTETWYKTPRGDDE